MQPCEGWALRSGRCAAVRAGPAQLSPLLCCWLPQSLSPSLGAWSLLRASSVATVESWLWYAPRDLNSSTHRRPAVARDPGDPVLLETPAWGGWLMDVWAIPSVRSPPLTLLMGLAATVTQTRGCRAPTPSAVCRWFSQAFLGVWAKWWVLLCPTLSVGHRPARQGAGSTHTSRGSSRDGRAVCACRWRHVFGSPCGPGRGWWPWSQSLPPTLLGSAPPKSAQWPPQNRTGPQGLGSRATAVTRGIQLSHGAPQPLGSSGGSLVSQPRWGARDQSVPCDQRLRSSQGGRGGLVRGRPGALAFELYIHSLSVAVNPGPLLPQVCLKYYEHEFVELACQCPAVVCCRCSPTQKAHIVKLLQQHTGRRTCAIGEHPHAPGRVPHSPLAGLQRHGTRGPDPCLLSAREAALQALLTPCSLPQVTEGTT